MGHGSGRSSLRSVGQLLRRAEDLRGLLVARHGLGALDRSLGRLRLLALGRLGDLAVQLAGDDGLRRAEQHRHVAPVEIGPLLDDGELGELLREAIEDVSPALGVRELAPAEHDRDLDLVTPLEEADDMALLGLVVADRDLRAELDLTDRDLLLMLASGLLV